MCIVFLTYAAEVVSKVPNYPSYEKIVKNIDIPHIVKPNIYKVSINSGDNMVSVLKNAGISNKEVNQIIHTVQKVYNINKLKVNDQVTIKKNGYNLIDYVLINTQYSMHSIKIYRNSKGLFSTQIIDNIKAKRIVRVSDIIRSSLFTSAIEQGLSYAIIMNLIKLYSNGIDLRKEIVPGSKFDVLFERFFDENGHPITDGKILYASLKTNNKDISLYRHLFKNGTEGYFDSKGNSIKKIMLQHPIDNNGAFYISSKFGVRKHPIYGYSKFHKGVDYAAPIGTPIRAAGDGVIEFVGINGGYGKYIRIRHNRLYSTAYAHINNVHIGIRKGLTVKQGQIIAYVGNTGSSTGPHLHYEVLYKGKHIDPQKVQETREIVKIPKNELPSFQLTMNNIKRTLKSTPYVTEFAMIKKH
ncbi:peptidase M23 family protein [Candidatus Neoehrlichia lotoris str. RAC413]|uniref:Peptidase M23 family protein n=2 Tax=Candidatus Neoehrlichia procyonis TaxID=467750 RepID=A0A0F3NMD0_9RICK|nr:peptidase M23 family protein [Candidatus Neoehrlichia lotoris str. RAC413]